MKKTIAVGLILSVGIATGFVLGLGFTRYPISGGYTVIHYCGCVEDQPQFQARVLRTAAEINAQIEQTTKEYARTNEVEENDFHARLIPHGNGNYEMVFWCSNRSKKIGSLEAQYRNLVKTCLAPHRAILKEAHEAYQERQAEAAQQDITPNR